MSVSLKQTIVLIEFVDEAKKIISVYGMDFCKSSQTKIISFHPKVKAYLKSLGIETRDTIAFLDNEAQHRIILKSEELTHKILSRFNLKDSLNISRGYQESGLHHLRLYFNHFLWVVEILDGVVKNFNVEKIIAVTPEKSDQMYLPKGYIQDSERFVGVLAQDFARAKNISFSSVGINLSKEPLKSRVLAFFVRCIGTILMALEYLTLGFKDYRKKETIVVPATSYRMDILLKEIKARNPKAKSLMIWEGQATFKQEVYKIYLTFSNLKNKLQGKELLDSVIHLDLLRNIIPAPQNIQKDFHRQMDSVVQYIEREGQKDFVYQGVSIVDVAVKKINKGFRAELIKLQQLTFCLSKVLKKICPKILMSMYSAGIYYMMGELNEKIGYKALNISHGTHVPPNNEFERIENIRLAASVITNMYPYVSVQTPWTNKFLDYYQDKRQRIITGPLLFSVTNSDDRLKLRKEILGSDDKKKIIIHAATQKGRHGMRFHITESLDEYVKTLSDIIEAVNQLNDIYFILRPHPICNLSEEEFKTLLPPCPKMRIITKGSFAKLLSASDLLLSYSSTCIEEAVQNKIPVILYDQWKRYNHFGIAETKNAATESLAPVYYITQPAILKNSIQAILKKFEQTSKEKISWPDYIYPKASKDNFFAFVDKSLRVP